METSLVCHPSPSKCSLWPCTQPQVHSPLDSSQIADTPPALLPTAPDRTLQVSGISRAGTEPVHLMNCRGEKSQEDVVIIYSRMPTWEHSSQVATG